MGCKKKSYYDYGEINWDEFLNVVKGNNPSNKERLEMRNNAWHNYAWVRAASTVYAK